MSTPLAEGTHHVEDNVRRLDNALLKGLAWTGGSRWLTQLVTWPATFLVARLLSPDEYGVVAMASVQIRILSLIIEAGLGSAVVVKSDLDEDESRQAHTLSLFIGIAALVVCALLAVPISRFYNTSNLIPIIVVLGGVLVMDSVRSVPIGLLRRQMRFKALAGVDVARGIVDAGTGLVLAWLGFGYWALVLQFVAGGVTATALVLVLCPIRFCRPRFSRLRAMVKLGGQFAVGSVAWYIYMSADMVIAGRILGVAALGAYSFAGMLANLPADRIATAVTRVAPSMFAEMHRDAYALRRYFSSLVAGLAGIVLPCLVGLALVADEFVEVILGPQWSAVVVPLRILTVFAAIKTLADLSAYLLSSVGRAGRTATVSVISALVLPPAFYLSGRFWGLEGLASTWLIVYPVLQLPVLLGALQVTGMRAGQLFRILMPSLVGCGGMCAGVMAARSVLLEAGWSPFSRLVVCVAIGVFIYGMAAAVLQRRMLLNLVGSVRTRHAAPSAA